jgi:hypothetical protein
MISVHIINDILLSAASAPIRLQIILVLKVDLKRNSWKTKSGLWRPATEKHTDTHLLTPFILSDLAAIWPISMVLNSDLSWTASKGYLSTKEIY